MDTIHGFCPECGENRQLNIVLTTERIVVHGEEFDVSSKYHECSECGASFFDPENMTDPRTMAFRLYRERHGMVQPEKIREFRKRYDLTQKELSNLLGLGGATLSRYENGAMQDIAHDNLLKLVMHPFGLELIVRNRIDSISSDKAERILALIH